MTKTAVGNENEEDGSRLLRAVEAIAISPRDANSIAERYLQQSRDRFPDSESWDHQLRAADKIIGRYSRLAAYFGSATGLPGIIPGLGTAVAIVGGAAADSLVCMKLQVDMCMCLAAVFKYDITSEDGKHLAFLIAATGSAQHAGVEAGVRLGSKAGVRMLRQYLKGAALRAVKQAFKRVGVTFTRKAVEKAIPFGIGAAVGGVANYGLTRYVGHQAKQWFVIDQTTDSQDTVDDGLCPDPPPAAPGAGWHPHRGRRWSVVGLRLRFPHRQGCQARPSAGRDGHLLLQGRVLPEQVRGGHVNVGLRRPRLARTAF